MFPARSVSMGMVLCLVSMATSADVVTRVDDERVVGIVASVDSSGAVVVMPNGGAPVSIPASEVLSITCDVKPVQPKGDLLVLASGERFRVGLDAVGMQLPEGMVAVYGAGSLSAVNSIALADLRAWVPAGGDVDKVLADVLALDNDRDVVLMASGDRLTGVVEHVGAKGASVTAKLGTTAVDRGLLLGIAFSKTLKPWREPVRLLAETRLADGSVVLGDVTGPKDGVFALRSVLGAEWKVAADQIVEIRFRGGKLLWLSDLAPAKAETTPFFNRAWPWRKDRSVWGNPLTVGGAVCERGLGTHSRTELAYDLAAQFTTFVADIAIDDETKGTGSATVSVTADGRTLLAPMEVNGADKPRRVKLDVSGIRRLTLLVDFGKNDDAGDHVDWLNARLIRR